MNTERELRVLKAITEATKDGPMIRLNDITFCCGVPESQLRPILDDLRKRELITFEAGVPAHVQALYHLTNKGKRAF